MVTKIFIALCLTATLQAQQSTLITKTFSSYRDSANGYSIPPYSTLFTDRTEQYNLSAFDSVTITVNSFIARPYSSQFQCLLNDDIIIYRTPQTTDDTTHNFTILLLTLPFKRNIAFHFQVSSDSTTVYSLNNLKIIGWK